MRTNDHQDENEFIIFHKTFFPSAGRTRRIQFTVTGYLYNFCTLFKSIYIIHTQLLELMAANRIYKLTISTPQTTSILQFIRNANIIDTQQTAFACAYIYNIMNILIIIHKK